MRPEIQAYFRSVAEKYRVVEHVRFHSIVEKAAWNDIDNVWEATILNLQTKERTTRRAKVLVSGVGSLSVPKTCDLPGVDTYEGKFDEQHTRVCEVWGPRRIRWPAIGCRQTSFLPARQTCPNIDHIATTSRKHRHEVVRRHPYSAHNEDERRMQGPPMEVW